MKKYKNKIDITKYKGAIIQFMCEECNQCDNFFEDFNDQISRIKSGLCSHFSLKFIFNFEGQKFRYILSFNCNNCNTNKIINLFDENTTNISPSINYKCEKCGKGNINIGLLLSEEKMNIDDDYEENNDKNEKKSHPRNNNINMINNNIEYLNQNLRGGNQQFNQQNPMNNNINNFNNNNMMSHNNMMFNKNNMMFNNNNNMMFNNNNNMMFNNNNMMFNDNNNMMFNNNNNMMFNDNNRNLNKNISKNNMMGNNNQLNNNLNNNKIKLIFKSTKGNSYEIFASPDESLAKIVRTLTQTHKEIDKKKIGTFVRNAKILQLQKTIKDNNLENNSVIMMTYN